jgi:hypothetical protein
MHIAGRIRLAESPSRGHLQNGKRSQAGCPGKTRVVSYVPILVSDFCLLDVAIGPEIGGGMLRDASLGQSL